MLFDKPVNILIIEDNPGDVELIKAMLEETRINKFELVWRDELKEGIEYLEQRTADIILLDLTLPDGSGLSTFTKLHEKYPLIPTIILTGLNDTDLAIDSVKAGAQDYLVKGAIDSTLISRSILYSIERERLHKIVQNELEQRIVMENALTKANRALKVISECNQVVVRAQNEEELFRNICRILIEVGEFCFVWIALIERDNSREMKILFHHSCNPVLDILREKVQSDYSSWYESREHVSEPEKIFFNNDIKSNTENLFLFADASNLGCNSVISLPIFYENHEIGYINIYSKEKNVFSEEEIKLLTELTDDMSLGIYTIRMQNEREATLKNLKESEERFRFIVEATNNVIYQLNYDTMKYYYINPAIKNLTGYTLEEINEIGFSKIIRKIKNHKFEGQPIELEQLKIKMRERAIGEWQADYLIRTKQGEYRWLTDHSYPWYSESGSLFGSTGIMSDITERMRAEEEIIIAKEQAEEMNRMKTNFLSNMSHELRTPMVGILGYSEIMKNETDDPSVKRMSNMIYLSGARLMETLNLILDLSRLEAGKVELKYMDIEVISIIKSVFGNYEEQARQKNIFLRVKTDFSTLQMKSDERMFINSLNNLINNAIKFTSRGGVSVFVELENKGEKAVIIKVADTGIGISKEDQEIMWDEFRQASEGFNRTYEGVGLGLTITRKFIQKLGGTIEVDSEIDKGSVFILRFVTDEVSVTYAENIDFQQELAIKLIEEDASYLPKVLVVDDDETSRSVMVRFLKEKCNIDTAIDGKDAIMKATHSRYDAILMDINLGKGMNGLESTKLIRKIEGYKSIPIIAVTAYAMKGDKEEFLEAGCTDYISKPFSKLQFITFIEGILDIG